MKILPNSEMAKQWRDATPDESPPPLFNHSTAPKPHEMLNLPGVDFAAYAGDVNAPTENCGCPMRAGVHNRNRPPMASAPTAEEMLGLPVWNW